MSTYGPLDVAEIGRRIADRRAALRLEQQQVAERAGLSRAHVSRLERGVVPEPRVTDLAKLAAALDLSLVELVRQPAGTRTERYSLECAELTERLAEVPPGIADTILRWWRDSVQIAQSQRVVTEN